MGCSGVWELGWREESGGCVAVGVRWGVVYAIAGCLLINSCNFLKSHRQYSAGAQVPLKKGNWGTLTYWFHARGKGPVPISERTQQSYCLPGLCSPLIWKFNYIITRSRCAFLTVDASPAPAASLWRDQRLLIALKHPFSYWHAFFWRGEQDYPHVCRLKAQKAICNATLLSLTQVISAPL